MKKNKSLKLGLVVILGLVIILAIIFALQSNYNNLFQGSISTSKPSTPIVTKTDGTPLVQEQITHL